MSFEGEKGLDLGLGKQQAYVDQYTPELLRVIPRSTSRSGLSLAGKVDGLPFSGIDLWTAYEVSWLDDSGKPNVAIAEIRVPADSQNIIESKSLKYYLNSFNQTKVSDRETLQAMMEADLSDSAGAPTGVQLFGLDEYEQFTSRKLKADRSECIDDLALPENVSYKPAPQCLQVSTELGQSQSAFSEERILKSHLLKTNCPVTGQPDWATVWIGYHGPTIVKESLLAYIVSFRRHDDFHENCVEKIFCDILKYCCPSSLWVYARYSRRGGLDINPFRSSKPVPLPRLKGVRQ